MEFLLGTLVGGVIGWIMRKSPADEVNATAIRNMLQLQLKNRAKQESNPDIAAGIMIAAEQITQPTMPTVPAAQSITGNPLSTEIPTFKHPSKELDNVSILLYFGAFLMLAGVGVFVGLSPYSGSIKTSAVLVMAVVFYTAGITLYKSFKRLKPVAVTLTAIGLVCLPLTGAAAYAYLSSGNGPMIWFVTSLGSLALYVFALYTIRQSLIGYMSVFMSLSLWLSIVSIIEAPVYFFAWAMIVMAMVYLAVIKFLKLWEEVQVPLAISASIMVPTALGMSVFFGITTINPFDHGITALLGALFYALAIWHEKSTETKHTYFALSYSLVTLGVLLITMGLHFAWIHSLYAVISIATVQLLIALVLSKKIPEDWRNSALTINGMSLVTAAIGTIFVDQQALTNMLVINLLIHTGAAFYAKHRIQLTLGLITLLALPLQVGFMLFSPSLEALQVGLLYIGIALTLLTTKPYIKRFGFTDIFIVGYYLALLMALLVGLYSTNNTPVFLTIVVGGLVLLGAYLNRQIAAIPFGAALLAAGIVWNLKTSGMLPLGPTTLTLLMLSVGYYIIGKLHPLWTKQEPWRDFGAMWTTVGHVGLYITAFLPIIYATPRPTIFWNALILILAGATTAYEGYMGQRKIMLYVGSGLSVMGLHWLLAIKDIESPQFYAHLWSGYFAALACYAHRRKDLDDKKVFTGIALLTLTLPMSINALVGHTQTGILLLFESIGLVLLGIRLKDHLIARWGLVVAVLCVLYQLREFQFFTLTLLGAGIIGAGIYLLLKQEKK